MINSNSFVLNETQQEEKNPPVIYSAPLKQRLLLNPGSGKETYHIEIDLSNIDIQYTVGDCLGIYPHNNPEYVSTIIKYLATDERDFVTDRNGARWPLYQFLSERANLARIPKKLKPTPECQNLAEFLEKTPVDAQTLCSALSPLLPRFYSIASSMKSVGKEAHLTVALSPLPPPLDFGTCSSFLCRTLSIGTPLRFYLHKGKHFTLSSESDAYPIIMVGPGTGIAPFRGFMQERIARGVNSENWLFFGERHQSTDFYYGNYWKDLERRGLLYLNTAFSRDQNEKVYVQHKLWERRKEIWNLLERGAHFFVCGDAEKMAKGVDAMLHLIIETEGCLSVDGAKSYVKNLIHSKRYIKDVY